MSTTPTPEVSVLVITYNHEKFVRQALDSVLMQKTDFDFEVVVGDDYSEDSTPEIIREYEAGDRRVRVLPTEKKLGITRNYRRGFEACRGRYVAVIEGDDFWISPRKLEILSGFLRQHPECSFCFHRIIRIDEGSDRSFIYPALEADAGFGLFTARQLAKGNFVGGFSTCMYRREDIERLDERFWSLKMREWPFNIVIAQHGQIGYIPEILSVYRGHPGGIWSMKTWAEQRAILQEFVDVYNEYLGFKFDAEFKVFKRTFLADEPPASKDHPGAETSPLYWRVGRRVKRLVKPFVPPVFAALARSIYDRAGGYRNNRPA